jgi:O-antigen/teichoic acid export membrane protein
MSIIILIFINISSIGIQEVIFINTISLAVSFILIEFILFKTIPQNVKISQPIYNNKWVRTALVLLMYKLMTTYILGSEVLFLGIMREDKEVGIYSIARKISGFVSFGLFASNIVLAPKIASLYQEGKIEILQLLVKKSIRIIFIFSLLIMVLLAGVSFPLLKFLGEEYVLSFIPLLIMMFGELINVAFGPVALLLISCNQEKMANRNMLFAIILNATGNLVLIHFFGYIGAAISTTVTVIAWNLSMAMSVKNIIGIKSGIW